MKSTIKLICIILSLILLACNIIGCSSSEDKTTTTKDSASVSGMPPLEGYSYVFWSLEELKAWLTPTDESDAPAMNEKGMKYESFRNFVQQIVNEKEPIYVPYLENDIVYMKNEEGFPDIYLESQDSLVKYTVLQYTTWIDGQEYWIGIFYLPAEEQEYASTHSISELIKFINSNHANIDNPKDAVENVYEENISLFDRTVMALNIELKPNENGRTRDYMYFVYDDILVRVWVRNARNHEFDKSWLKDLNFQPLP